MKLYLMQHALAYPAEENPERPITPEGIEQTKAAAAGIKALGIKFDLIMASTKRRAQQTAALIAEKTRYPYSDIVSTDALLPNAETGLVKEILRSESAEEVLLVGHLPHLARLTTDFLHGAELVFSNCGLSCLELSGTDSAKLLFHLQAEHLRE